jgi:Tol biopolymer transport system component
MVGVRRLSGRVTVLALSVAMLCACIPEAQALDAGGVKGQQHSGNPVLSADGRYMAFTSGSILAPPDSTTLNDVYVRDLDTGLTVLASRASGPSGAAASGSSVNGGPKSFSADGRFVVFQSRAGNLSPDDTNDASLDIYVRDLQTQTTTLVSRATGVAGAKGNGTSAGAAQMSADGRYVAFQSAATNLDPADTDANDDVFLRDLQTATTTLIDRSSGVNGAKASRAFAPAISGDGRYVAFTSDHSGITPDDPDTHNDVFVRDVQSSTTTLVSRATGASGVKGNAASVNPQISSDGTLVAWTSFATNLDPDDTDALGDTYVRDLVANTTKLITRASGPNGAKGNGHSGGSGFSGDGRYVAFASAATNLDPADTDTITDSYMRDLQTDSTILISRATGALGVKGNGASSGHTTLSSDGRYAAFTSTSTNLSPDDTSNLEDIYVRDLQTFVTSLESRATPGHARPKGATPLRVALVPAYAPCTAPNRTHGPALAFPSCAPPSQASAHLTVGTPDATATPLNSVGFVRLEALVGDFGITASITDVRCAAALPTCGAANTAGGSDYTGELRGSVAVRQTDKFDSSGEAISTTVSDHTLAFTLGCTTTAANIGGSCSVSTTANALAPGMIRNGDRTSMELGTIQLHDGGPDGDADTAGDSVFATQGVFIP